MKSIALTIASLSLIIGCGSDDLLTDAEGIYLVDSHTENLQECTQGGEPLVDPDGAQYLLAYAGSAFGQDFLSMRLCAAPGDCRALTDEIDEQGPFALLVGYSAGDVNGALESNAVSAGFESDGVCSRGSVETTRTTRTENGLEIIVEHVDSDDYPAVDGECSSDAAELAAANNSCSSRIDLRATFVESL